MSKEWLERAYILRGLRHTGTDLALCVKEGQVIAAATSPAFDPASTSLRSPITTLLHHLDITRTENAILVSTCPPSEMCKGMARLFSISAIWYRNGAGQLVQFTSDHKRPGSKLWGAFAEPAIGPKTALPAEVAGRFDVHNDLKAFQAFDVPANVEDLPMAMLLDDPGVRDRFFMYLTLEIARRAFGASSFLEKNRGATHYGKNIASLLVGEDGTVLSWGVNTNQREKWRHAEVNTLCNYIRGGGAEIPEGATLYTTLEPCEMCAGLVAHLGRGPRLRVISAMTDSTLGDTALNKDAPANIKVSATAASLFLSALTNAKVADKPLPTELKAQFDEWRKAEGPKVRMTEFFNTQRFLDMTSAARQHWFEVLWSHLQQKFAKKHAAFCEANLGKAPKPGAWGQSGTPGVPAQRLGDLLKKPEHEAAFADLQQMSRNLHYVFETFDAFLRGIPARLR